LDVSVELIVKAAPKIGSDEKLEVVVGKPVMMTCDVKGCENEQCFVEWKFVSEAYVRRHVPSPFPSLRTGQMSSHPMSNHLTPIRGASS